MSCGGQVFSFNRVIVQILFCFKMLLPFSEIKERHSSLNMKKKEKGKNIIRGVHSTFVSTSLTLRRNTAQDETAVEHISFPMIPVLMFYMCSNHCQIISSVFSSQLKWTVLKMSCKSSFISFISVAAVQPNSDCLLSSNLNELKAV